LSISFQQFLIFWLAPHHLQTVRKKLLSLCSAVAMIDVNHGNAKQALAFARFLSVVLFCRRGRGGDD